MKSGEPNQIRPASPENIEVAARLLGDGRLVAFPTETVYGLGADARNDRAVAGIFAAKGRPRFNPLIVHFDELEAAARAVVFDTRARRVAERFWPGPLTLVLPRAPACQISLLCSAGLDTQAVRLPNHPVAKVLLTACGCPIAGPSANAAGRISPTSAADVLESLGDRVDLILDGGPCPVGLESTVLDLSGKTPRLLRPGAVTLEDLSEVIDEISESQDSGPLKSPGQLTSHYAPNHAVLLAVEKVTSDQALLAFGPAPLTGGAMTLNLSESGNLEEAAANLFAHLRALDRSSAKAIAVMPIPQHGLGAAINDRLKRAAAPRNNKKQTIQI